MGVDHDAQGIGPQDDRVPVYEVSTIPLVIVVGPFPPPVHGAAAVTQAVCKLVEPPTELVQIDTSPGFRSGVLYHLHRVRRHAAALCALIRHRRRQFRRIYAACPGGLGLWYLLPILMVARLLGYVIVVHHHSYKYLVEESRVMRMLVATAGTRSVHVLLCGQMRTRFCDLYKPRGEAISCSNAAWMRTGLVPPTSHCPAIDGRFRLGHLGRLSSEKGLDQVLATLGGLLDMGIDAQLVLAGPIGSDSDRRLLEASEVKFGGRLHLLGPVSGDAKDAFFASLDAFLFPTRYIHEAEPLVVLEALAAGVRVVAFARGCIGRMIRGDSGLVISADLDFAAVSAPYLAALAGAANDRETGRNAAFEAFEHHQAGAAEARRGVLNAIASSQQDGRNATTL